jgi:hypothetical protein
MPQLQQQSVPNPNANLRPRLASIPARDAVRTILGPDRRHERESEGTMQRARKLINAPVPIILNLEAQKRTSRRTIVMTQMPKTIRMYVRPLRLN